MQEDCDTCTTKLQGWGISSANTGVTCGPFAEGNERSLLIDLTKEGVGFVEQAITIPEVKEVVVFTLAARLRVEDLSAKGASLNVACYDASGGFLTNKDQGLFTYNWSQGTRPWEQRTIKFILPEGTAQV